MGRKFIITEEQRDMLSKMMIGEEYEPGPQDPPMKQANKPYCISPDKVNVVKRFLDGGFGKGKIEMLGANGYPQTVKIIAMKDSQGNVLKNLLMDEMEDLLIDRFQNMFSDHDERGLFMKQVLSDWYDNKIGVFGTLSVNSLT